MSEWAGHGPDSLTDDRFEVDLRNSDGSVAGWVFRGTRNRIHIGRGGAGWWVEIPEIEGGVDIAGGDTAAEAAESMDEFLADLAAIRSWLREQR